ncbi:hypothetical protein [Actinoplanes subtropicus]|uniref:hypothetical protein n=1 Tax=Actinoplanes subtropicus TaxID=543632 RepID=UPI0012F88A7F|nr:hypothetical protein [Actinoplanes subtropicus]
MTTPGWYDPDYDDPAAPLPADVESARAWALPPVIAKRPPFDAWWCPDCQRLQQDGLHLHDHARAERQGTSGSVCPATGVVAVRIGARPPVPAGPGLPLDGWWCPTCRYLVPDAAATHPSRAARPVRTEGCTNRRYRSVRVTGR